MQTNKAPALAVIGGDLRSVSAAKRLGARFDIKLYGFGDVGASECGVVDSSCCSAVASGAGELGRSIAESGLTLAGSLEEALDGAFAAMLPLPASQDGIHVATPCFSGEIALAVLLDAMEARGVKHLLGGKLPRELAAECVARGIRVYDYYEREEFAVANAIPSAEGAIFTAMSELRITLHGAKALVVGYGRIGKMLARRLDALGSDVTATARRASDLEWIKSDRIRAHDTRRLAELLGRERFDVIFSTVPTLVLTERELRKISPETLVIDLASTPGGIDISAARGLGIRVIRALSLPGKYSPVTAGEIIADVIAGLFEEENLC